MANFECNGISKLMKRIDDMGQAPDKVKKRLVNQGANLGLTQMKSDALSQFKGTGQGARSLAILEGRSGDSYLFLDVGIGEQNWYDCRGLYFQHYGFKSKSATLWMTSSYKRSKSKVSKLIRDGLKKELNL